MMASAHGWKRGLVLARHPELLADHADRVGVGEVVDDVDLVPPVHLVDEAGDDALHFRAGRGGLVEVLHGQRAQPVVLGRVHGDEALGRAGAGGGEPRVVDQRHDFAVGADDVAAVLGPQYRCLAQLGVKRVGIRSAGVVEDLREQSGLGVHRHHPRLPANAHWRSVGE
jgi:hypothetical protein